MSDTIRVTLLIEGNEGGTHYRDARDMADDVTDWIEEALWYRSGLTAWSIQVETEEDE